MAFRASGSKTVIDAGGTTITVPTTGVVDGDALVIGFTIDSSGGTVSTLAGWTAHPGNPITVTADGQRMYSFSKNQASSEPGGGWVWSVNLNGSSSIAAAWASFSGRSATPFSVTPTSQSSSTGSASPRSMACTGLTATANADLCYLAMLDLTVSQTTSFAAPASFTEAVDVNDTAAASITIDYQNNVSAGATGTITGTGTYASGNAGYAAFLYCMDAAAAAANLGQPWQAQGAMGVMVSM